MKISKFFKIFTNFKLFNFTTESHAAVINNFNPEYPYNSNESTWHTLAKHITFKITFLHQQSIGQKETRGYYEQQLLIKEGKN